MAIRKLFRILHGRAVEEMTLPRGTGPNIGMVARRDGPKHFEKKA